MASERAHRLIKAAESARLLSNAIKARRRLQAEGIKLIRAIGQAQERLGEIDGEEEVHAAAIEEHGGAVSAANREPDPVPVREPSEAEVPGSHP